MTAHYAERLLRHLRRCGLAVASIAMGGAAAWAQGPAPAIFVPPPRTIGDITAILDQQKPDPVKREAARAAADVQPKPGLSPGDLSRFYYDRGLAAMDLGRIGQSVEDFRSSLTNGRQARFDMGRAIEALYRAESMAGNAKAAAALAEAALREASPRVFGPLVANAGTLVDARLRLGDVPGAEKALAQAEDYLRQAGQSRNAAVGFLDHWNASVEGRRAALMAETGRYADAERAARQALMLQERAAPRYDEMAANSPVLMFPRGQMERLAENWRGLVAQTLRAQGRLVEAEVEARRVLLNLLSRFGRYTPDSGKAISLLSSILFEEGRFAEAETLAKAAVETYESVGSGPGSYALANALTLVAKTQAARERWTDARATFDRLATQIATDDASRAAFVDGNVMLGLVQVKTGAAVQAVPIMEKAAAVRTRKFGDRHVDTAEARGFLGLALAAAGQRDRALAEFRAAIPILLQASRQTDDEAGATARDQRVQLILEAYMGVLADSRGGAEAAAESFRLADAARGRSVQRALAAASARATANPALADLARREQDAQKQIAALQTLLSNLLSSPTDQQDAGAIRSLREQIDKLRDSRARMREEIEKRFPDYVNLIDPRPATIEQARAALKAGEALISTYVGADRTFVWAVPKDGAPAFAAAALKDRDIDTMVRTLRKALDPNAATLGDIPAFDVALANRLYAALLAPVAGGWQSAASLLIVPHKALGQLPFGLLVTEAAARPADNPLLFSGYKNVPFLIRKAAVTQLPSVTALATLRALPAPDASRKAFAGFGDPLFSPQQAAQAQRVASAADVQSRGVQTRGIRLVRRNAPATQGVNSADLALLPRLPDTADEVRNIAVALNADLSRDVFLGAQASEQTVRTMNLADRKVVLFATHGLVPGDLNGLTQPALALSAPSVTHNADDGLLTMEDILALRLNADWVVLSACNTASGDGAGAEAVSGLGRAFFYAGARALLVSNWPVETVSARALTTDLFKRQAADPRLGRAEALRRAMLALIDGPGALDPTGAPQFSYAHPIFWAPFSVVGDGG